MENLKCGEYFATLVASHQLTRSNIETYTLNYTEAYQCEVRVRADSLGLCFNAIASFGSALQDIRRNAYGWAIVKAYYSVFYSLRAILAANGTGIAYLNSTPIHVPTTPGAQFKKLKGQTHVAVCALFRRQFPSDSLVVNVIDGDDPFDWLRDKRELVNYRTQRFPELAESPGISDLLVGNSLRRIIDEYLSTATYAFDSDHAAIALPLACISRAAKSVNANVYSRQSQVAVVRALLSDSTGPIPKLYERFVTGLQNDGT